MEGMSNATGPVDWSVAALSIRRVGLASWWSPSRRLSYCKIEFFVAQHSCLHRHHCNDFELLTSLLTFVLRTWSQAILFDSIQFDSIRHRFSTSIYLHSCISFIWCLAISWFIPHVISVLHLYALTTVRPSEPK